MERSKSLRAQQFFTAAQQQRIRETVARVEQDSRGEIVPLVIDRAGDYRSTSLTAAGLLAWAGLVLLLWWQPDWPAAQLAWRLPLVYAVLFGLGFAALELLPGLKRRLIRPAVLDERVRERALALFMHYNLHTTRDHTGVLILISLFERRVRILADSGINARVAPEYWQQRVDDIVAGLHRQEACEALCQAIDQCHRLLAEHFPHNGGANPNELPDLILH